MKKISLFFYLIVLLTISNCKLPDCNNKQSNKTLDIKGEYICISLNEFLQKMLENIETQDTILAEIDSLFGMSWLEGYVIDKENSDIIIVGKCIPSRPAYFAEDIIVNFQNVFDSTISPYCSLDPYPENIKKLNECLNSKSEDFDRTINNLKNAIGGQQVVVGGVPRNSRHAKIMIYADYDMKKISQGLLTVPGITSCIDLSIADSIREEESKLTMSRFWLNIKENDDCNSYPNFFESEGIVFIRECPVVILTEKQYSDKEGKLQDDKNEEDKIADAFAENMSLKYDKLTSTRPFFAQLENLFRLQACFMALQYKNAVSESGFDKSIFSDFKLRKGNELPETLPGLINYKTTEKVTSESNVVSTLQKLFLAAGGVSMEMKLAEESKSFYAEANLKDCQSLILKSKPAKQSVFWQILLNDAN